MIPQPVHWRVMHHQTEEQQRLRRGSFFAGMSLLLILIAMVVMEFATFNLSNVLQEKWYTTGRFADYLWMSMVNWLVYCLALGLPVVLLALGTRSGINPFARRRPAGFVGFWSVSLAGMAVCICASYIAFYFVRMISSFFPSSGLNFSPPEQPPVPPGVFGYITQLISTALLPAFIEEMVFRGYILESLRPFGETRAVAASAVLFSLLHGNLTQIPFSFILGLLFAAITIKTGNIFIPIMIHFLNNGLSVTVDHFDLNWFHISIIVSLIGGGLALVLYTIRHPVTERLSDCGSLLPGWRRNLMLFGSPMMIISTILMVLLTLLYTFNNPTIQV